MGAVKSLVALAAGAVIGAGALIAYRICQETGKSFQEALSEVPGELERLYSELRDRGTEVLEAAGMGDAVKEEAATDLAKESETAQK